MKNNIAEIIEYGLDTIPKDLKIELSVRDFIRIYKVIEENRRFFHTEMHYKNLSDVNTFIGDHDSGMFKILNELYIPILDSYLSPELEQLIESEELECPDQPYYYTE